MRPPGREIVHRRGEERCITAVSALTAKAKLAGMWRDKVNQHKTGTPAYEHIERIERIIVDPNSDRAGRD